MQEKMPSAASAASASTATSSTVSADSSLYAVVEEKDSVSFLKDTTLLWAIDMDGTLIREDVTVVARDISFALPQRYWLICIVCLFLYYTRLSKILAYRIFERFVPIDPTLLSYHQPLLQYIQQHRHKGGTVILASATHVWATRLIAQHVNSTTWSTTKQLYHQQQQQKYQRPTHNSSTATTTPVTNAVFNHVIGSDPVRGVWNAAGAVKAQLIHQFAVTQNQEYFVYAGNAVEDLDVWSHPACKAMVLVNCSTHVLQQAKQLPKPYIVLE
jgi:hypothetical protein